MAEPADDRLKEARQTFRADAGPRPGGGAAATADCHRAKVFKSGNSLALRLPKALGLEAGMEMELRVAAEGAWSLRRADAPKRRIDVSKFAGKAPWLKPLTREEREFEHRELDWRLLGGPGSRT